MTVPSDPVGPTTTTVSPTLSADSELGCEAEILEFAVVATLVVLPVQSRRHRCLNRRSV